MRVLAVVVVAVLAAAALAAGTAGARPHEASAPRVCLGEGAPWERGVAQGRTYVITLGRGTTCAFARPWVRRLSAVRATRSGQRLAGPRGYVCVVTIPFGGKAAGGACGRRGGGPGFGWVPRFS